jgi:hypothetical protein
MTTYEKIKEIKMREGYQIEKYPEIAKEIEIIKNSRHSWLGYTVGYHTPANANWSYIIELISVNNRLYETVQQFGEVVHAAYVSMNNYSVKDA